MKPQPFSLLVVAAIAASCLLPVAAQPPAAISLEPMVVEAAPRGLEIEGDYNPMQFVEIRNLQDVRLGRVRDLGVDLTNGRIVEVLVLTDDDLDLGGQIVAVPPLALWSDPMNEVYRLNISAARFKTAAAVERSPWEGRDRSNRVAATYRLFGQEIFFLEQGETASSTARRPKLALGYVERSSKILGMEIRNPADQELGKVWSMGLDLTTGRILSVVVVSQGNFKIKNVVPAMALSFNATRDGLVLDDTKAELENEPRYYHTVAAYGQDAHWRQESYTGPRTSTELEQGRSYRDIDQTVRINQEIRATGIDCESIEVGTLHDRVTLRGEVDSADEKHRIGESAIRVSRVRLVDNQITVKR